MNSATLRIKRLSFFLGTIRFVFFAYDKEVRLFQQVQRLYLDQPAMIIIK